MTARGGKRSGAGRKRGIPNKRTIASRELADKAIAEGISPLEVLLGTMRGHWDAGDKDAAAGIAKDAAPYVHPRLSATTVAGDPEGVPILQRIEQVIVDNAKD